MGKAKARMEDPDSRSRLASGCLKSHWSNEVNLLSMFIILNCEVQALTLKDEDIS